ncbi:hypothetical protein C9374_009561 [Naegleria lovaniensis]|uniref:Kazal-like domain-containing protein n=1 Tax=Naegleria lovaniensis TaxID=51637 RepID=A0AA88GYM5_NAELO|nr:uncharacterized protein C9374_009561 [Naegleria lovaniensis]KAG2392984.1 hypothetical protein C9374_009561 [Naegleria lovaniensis]
MKIQFSLIFLLLSIVVVTLGTTIVAGKSQTDSNLSAQFDAQFQQILKSDITKLSYADQQKALQEHVKQINKLTKNQKDLQLAWQSLDRLEQQIKKEYVENNRKVIVAQAKVTKACKLVEYYKILLKRLQMEILKIRLSSTKKTKLTKYYTKLIKKYKVEMEKAYEIYQSSIKVSKQVYSEYVVEAKKLSKQIEKIRLQISIIELMKQKLYSTQSLEVELSTMIEEWEQIIHQEEVTHIHEKERCQCAIEYRPVCGVNGLTYNSACTARCANVDIHYHGACKCIPQEEVIVVSKESALSSASI